MLFKHKKRVFKTASCSLAFAVVSALVSVGADAAVGNPRLNQVGYLPNSAKVASYHASNNTPTSLGAHPKRRPYCQWYDSAQRR